MEWSVSGLESDTEVKQQQRPRNENERGGGVFCPAHVSFFCSGKPILVRDGAAVPMGTEWRNVSFVRVVRHRKGCVIVDVETTMVSFLGSQLHLFF